MKTVIFALSTTLLLCSTTILFANNQNSANFNVKISIKESCNISTQNTSDLDFGIIERSSANTTTQGNFNITCTTGTPYNISLKSNRIMHRASSNDEITYTLYQDAAQKNIWGSDQNNTYSNIGSGVQQNIAVWGKVTGDQTNIPAGNYADTVTAVITY